LSCLFVLNIIVLSAESNSPNVAFIAAIDRVIFSWFWL
jgi:hypothetical protein